MSTFVDFSALKESVAITQVVDMLGLKMKASGPQLRGACPVCKGAGDRALAVNTDKQSYYCFGVKAGGDMIALVAHACEMTQKDAAQKIASYFDTVPRSAARTVSTVAHRSSAPEGGRTAARFLVSINAEGNSSSSACP